MYSCHWKISLSLETITNTEAEVSDPIALLDINKAYMDQMIYPQGSSNTVANP